MKITGLNQLLSTTGRPQQALAPNEQTHEISNRESRHIEHEKKANDAGWKANKNDVQKLRVFHYRTVKHGHKRSSNMYNYTPTHAHYPFVYMFFIKPSKTNKKFNWVVQIIKLNLQPL